MVFYNISICSFTKNPVSGGEKFSDEIIPRLAKKTICKNYFGFNAKAKEWERTNQNNSTTNLFEREKGLIKPFGKLTCVVLYVAAFIRSLRYLKRFDLSKKNLIISHSDAWPDVLLAFLLKKINKNTSWIAILHMATPNPLKGYKFSYRRGWHKIPSPCDLYQWLNQKLFFILQKNSDLLVSVNPNDEEFLRKKNKNVLMIKYGREYVRDVQLSTLEKKYDICFLGRFYEQKGIDEIPEIFKNLKKIYEKKLSIIIIGSKNSYSEWLEDKLRNFHPNYQISFVGTKYGQEKYDLLRKSKVMILPSYYESFGIVYLDAISVGTPVVEYDLPCYTDHKYGALKAPYLDNALFAQKVVELLTDAQLYSKISTEGYKYSKLFDWDKTANVLLEAAENIAIHNTP